MTTNGTRTGATPTTHDVDPRSDRRSAILVRTQIETTTSGHRADPDRRRPWPCPLRLGLGLALGAAGLVIVITSTRNGIEAELERRVDTRLVEAGLDPATFDIDFDVRSGRVVGPLPQGWTATRLRSVVDVDGAASVDVVVTREG